MERRPLVLGRGSKIVKIDEKPEASLSLLENCLDGRIMLMDSAVSCEELSEKYPQTHFVKIGWWPAEQGERILSSFEDLFQRLAFCRLCRSTANHVTQRVRV